MIADELLKRNLAEMSKVFGRLSKDDKQKESMRQIMKDTSAYLIEYAGQQAAEPQAARTPYRPPTLEERTKAIIAAVRAKEAEKERIRIDAIDRARMQEEHERKMHEYIYGPPRAYVAN